MKKTVIITGASRGIGRASAIRFAASDYNIAFNSLHGGADAENLIAKLMDKGAKVLNMTGDVSDEVFVTEMVRQTYETFGRIDTIINNAGISYVGLVQDISSSSWNRILNVNLSSVHYISKSVIPYLLRTKSGHIINVSSVWGTSGASCEAAYSATKGGINAYTKSLAKELAPSGISVNAVACGIIDTDMNKCFSEEDIKALCEEIPAGRLGTAEEVAELLYAISCQSPYLTGQVITLSGGWQI